MSSVKTTNPFVGLLALGLLAAALYGWIMNIVLLFQLTLDSPLGWIIGRVAGVFIPIIGAVIGYF